MIENRSTLVVRAGAGSGKTHTMCCAMRLYPGALGISHTRLACETMKQRIASMCYDCYMSTIHGIALRLAGKAAATTDPEGGVDYDRMLQECLLQLENGAQPLPDWLRSRRYLVVDEFQDTGGAQARIVELLCQRLECGLAAVGDFAQSIYSFQGASPDHLNKLRSQSTTTDVELKNNYRSHPLIVDHANRLSHSASGRINGAVHMRSMRKPAPGTRSTPLQLRCYSSDANLVYAIVKWIRTRRAQGILRDGDELTLFPSTMTAIDYAGRLLELTRVEEGASPIPDGARVTLRGDAGDNAPLSVGTISIRAHGTGGDAFTLHIKNPPRRILVACREVRGKRGVLHDVYLHLLSKNYEKPDTMFLTDRDNMPTNQIDKTRMRGINLLLKTVHGAKGDQFDSVLHIDLGESIWNPFRLHSDNPEEHRILYVCHTRAIDELWHMAMCKPRESTLTRYMTPELVGHFQPVQETWESDAPSVDPVYFDPDKNVEPELCEGVPLSVSRVAEKTKTVWEPGADFRPPVMRVVWSRTPKLSRLPSELHMMNAAHGQLCEWICLWHMHESSTRLSLTIFLDAVLRKYSVNKAFATAMHHVFAAGSDEQRLAVRAAFDEARQSPSQASAGVLFDAIRTACDACDGKLIRLRQADVAAGIENVRHQRTVQVDPDSAICPVRHTVRHFDSYTGMDTWKLDDSVFLKERVIAACRAVRDKLGQATLKNKFICQLFLQAVGLKTEGAQMQRDSSSWSVLLVVLKDEKVLNSYLAYMESQLPNIEADAADLRGIGMTTYQKAVSGCIVVTHRETGNCGSYALDGVADGASDSAVLEVTSRTGNYKTKVQQAHLYASLLDASNVYNYYVEERMLVCRTRTEKATSFLNRTAEDLLASYGLPGLENKPMLRTTLLADWNILVTHAACSATAKSASRPTPSENQVAAATIEWWKTCVRERKERGRRVEVRVLTFVQTLKRLVAKHHERKTRESKSQLQQNKQSDRITGVRSKSKTKPGLNENAIRKLRLASTNMFQVVDKTRL